MAEADRLLGTYLHLARASQLRQQPLVQVKLLVLAGAQAEEMGLAEISALCRHRVLAQNPRHLLRRWPTLAEALRTEAFQTHLKQLRRRYSREKAEHMLHSLGIEMAQERELYFSDAEYAAALLHTRPDAIAEILAGEDTPAASAAARVTQRSSVAGKRVPSWLVVWGPFVGGLLALAALAVWVIRVD